MCLTSEFEASVWWALVAAASSLRNMAVDNASTPRSRRSPSHLNSVPQKDSMIVPKETWAHAHTTLLFLILPNSNPKEPNLTQ